MSIARLWKKAAKQMQPHPQNKNLSPGPPRPRQMLFQATRHGSTVEKNAR